MKTQDELDREMEIATNDKYGTVGQGEKTPKPPEPGVMKKLVDMLRKPKDKIDRMIEENNRIDEAMGRKKPKGDDAFY
jgi:hypothetical protein